MKPMLFNTEMVRAILNGTKTVTRRLIRPQPPQSAQFYMGANTDVCHAFDDFIMSPGLDDRRVYMAPYKTGDIIYVRETWAEWSGGYVYKADGTISTYPISFVDKWRPSIHMPKEAARIFLRVTDVRAERLQEITDKGIRREGCGERDIIYCNGWLRCEFVDLWDSTIQKKDIDRCGWAANPWVWVIEFERCEKPEEE